MKILKRILMVLVVLVVLVAVISFILPTEFNVERKVVIDAPSKVIEKQVRYYESFVKWNPWADYDTAMVTEQVGTDGEVGAKYSWDGPEMGKGSMQITGVTANRVDQDLVFVMPFGESKNKTWYEWNQTEQGVELTWGMSGTNVRPFNVMSLFMSMDDMIGKDYDRGLGRVKERAETMAKQTNFRGFEVKEIEMSPRVYIAKKSIVKFQDMSDFFASSFKAVKEAMSKKKIEALGGPSGVYFVWDEPNSQAEMAAGLPAAEGTKLDGFESIPASGKTLHIAYLGDPSGTGEAHYAIDDYMSSRGIASSLVIEEYTYDPMVEKDTTKWLTNIYYILK